MLQLCRPPLLFLFAVEEVVVAAAAVTLTCLTTVNCSIRKLHWSTGSILIDRNRILTKMAESSGYLALRWNNHRNIFAKILDDLRIDESYCDVSLSCGGQFFPAHKFVLATCSQYFKEMFTRTPCNHPIIYMKDVTPQDMEALLDFMYKGEVHVAETQVTSLLATAEGLRVKGLAIPDNNPPPLSTSHSLLVTPQPTALNKSPASFLSTHGNKRMRSADCSPRKDDPPKLTPLPKTGTNSSSDGSSRFSAPPELKRFKQTPNSSGSSLLPRHLNGPESESQSRTSSCVDSQDSFLLNGSNVGVEYLKKSTLQNKDDFEERSTCSSEDGSSSSPKKPVGHTTDAVDRAREEDEDLCRHSPNSNYIKEEPFQNNGNLDNDDETNEVLQVDLSEDGTQFIIGPGGRMMAERDDPAEEEPTDGQKKPFVCPLCGHDFTRRDNLANHLKTHTGDRPYMCQYCHKCFSRKDYLKQHERIHTGEKPYQCPQCDRAFTRKEGMTDHMRCHSDYKEFACDVCSKSFKQKCGLRFHKRNYKH